MRLLLSVMSALSVSALLGCTILPAGPGAVIGDFMVTLSANSYERTARVFQGNPVELSLSLINRGRPRTLILSRRPAYDFVITTAGGMEVWRWAHGKTIEEISKEIWVAVGAFYTPRVSWDQRDLEGFPVPPGTYWVQGMLYTDIGILKSQRVELRIRQGAPLKLELEIPSQAPPPLRGEDFWRLGEPISLTLKLRNVTERAVELTLLGRPAYDFIVTARSREVWRWAQGQPVQEIAEMRRLAPSQELQFSVEWDQRDLEGQPIAPGRYCVQARVRVDPPVEEELVQCLWIARELPLELVLEVPERIKRGENVPLIWKVTNPSACPVTVVDSSLDFTVTTPEGTVVVSSAQKQWWRFPIPIKPPFYGIMTLQPRETRSFEGTWDQFDDEDYPVPPGVYWVRGFLGAAQETDALSFVQSAPQLLVIER